MTKNNLEDNCYIDFYKIKDEYNKLQNLKNIFGFKNIECNNIREEIRKKANYYNFDNTGLLQYMLGSIYHAPDIIKLEFIHLKNCYNNEQKYKQKYNEIRLLFKEHRVFKRFKKRLHSDLFLENVSTIYVNSLFYEFAEDYLNRYIYIEPNNIEMNFHFLLSWLDDNVSKENTKLLKEEKFLCDLIIADYDIPAIFECNFLNGIECIDEILDMVNTSIPDKLNVKTFPLAITKYIVLKAKIKNYYRFNINKYEIIKMIYTRTLTKEQFQTK